MPTTFLGELLGTTVLIILGDGVVADALLARSKGENAGWIAITAGWTFAVIAGIFTATVTGSADARLNPAVTLAAAIGIVQTIYFATSEAEQKSHQSFSILNQSKSAVSRILARIEDPRSAGRPHLP